MVPSALAAVGSPLLADAHRRYLDASNADRTGGRHSTGVRYWITYRVHGCGLTPIPDPRDTSYDARAAVEDSLEGMAVWIAETRPYGNLVSHESIGKYVSSVRGWYRRFYRARLGLPPEASRISEILKGYAREVEQPLPRERDGCSPRDLAVGMSAAGMSLMQRAALTFGMSALARGVEFALDSSRKERFDASQHMTGRDVALFYSDGRRCAKLRMRKRKDLRVLRGKHAVVFLSGSSRGYFDAVGCLEEWMVERRAAGISLDAPLFCHQDGTMVTVAEVRTWVKAAMAAAGRDPSRYGAHSLRIGGATAALAAGVSPSLIRLMGRWSSDVYEVYCRMSQESALHVGEMIASAMVTGAGDHEEFHSEHLELLQSEVESTRWDGGGIDEDEF